MNEIKLKVLNNRSPAIAGIVRASSNVVSMGVVSVIEFEGQLI